MRRLLKKKEAKHEAKHFINFDYQNTFAFYGLPMVRFDGGIKFGSIASGNTTPSMI